MFALLKKSRNLSLSMDVMLKRFNVLVKPVVLYGAEVWGGEKCDILERLQLRFFKYVLSVNKFTSSMMVYGELGAIPLDGDININISSLPIEAGVLRDMRICQFCETDICDEFHYLLCCPNFKEERKHFNNSKYYVRPSIFYLHKLFEQTKGENLKKLAMFVKIILCKF